MYRESGIHEDLRGLCTSIPKVTAKNRTHAEFASWTSASFQSQSEKTSADHQSKRSEVYEETRSAKFEKTRSGNIDFRIQGLPHSTVQKEDDVRRDMVKKLIHHFDTHPNRDSLMEDLNKTEEFNRFSEKLGVDPQLVQHGVLRICARSLLKYNAQIVLYIGMLASKTAPAANACSRRKRNRQLNKDRYDVWSIPNFSS